MQDKKPENTTRPGNPLWDEYIDADGQCSLEIHDPVKISQFDTCDHYYELKGNDAVCKRCGLGQPVIIGKQFIKEGKIIKQVRKK